MATWEDRLAPLLEPAQQFFGGLSARDRLLVVVTASALLLGGGALAMRAMGRQVRSLESNIRARRGDLELVQLKAFEYQAAMDQVRGLEDELASFEDFSLTAFLEEAAARPGIQLTPEQIRNVTDRGEESGTYFTTRRASMDLTDISYEQAVRMVHWIEAAPQHLRIDNLTLKPDFRDRTKMTLNLEVLFFQPVDGGV